MGRYHSSAAEHLICFSTQSTNDREIYTYRQTFNISHTLVDNKFVDHSDVDGASPVGAAPTTSSFST